MLEFLSILHDTLLQVATASNSTLAIPPNLPQQVDSNSTSVSTALGAVITTAAGLVGKHLYDTRKRQDTLTTASDIDRMQQKDIADNYDDYTEGERNWELFFSMIMNNKDSKISDVLDMVIDSVTKETLGMRMITHFRNIQRYNTEYYKNIAFKADSLSYTSNNPLKNTRNFVRDMTTTTTPAAFDSSPPPPPPT